MLGCLKISIVRYPNVIHTNFRWGGEVTTLYLLNQMNAFTPDHVLLWQKDTNTYVEHDAERSKWLNALIIASPTDEQNIQVNNKFDLLTFIEQGGVVRLKLMHDKMIFMSESVVQSFNN